MKLKIFQFEVKPADVDANEQQIAHYFENDVTEETDCVVLPEMWNNGYALEQLETLADQNLARSLPFISKLAQHYHVDVIAGSVSNKIEGKIYNTAFSVNKEGQLISTYNKVHLVPMLDEPSYLTGGQQVPELYTLSHNTKVTQIICYDLRFPELLRFPARNGAQIAFYVAQWPSARVNHWRALLQARAIENDMFVVGANGCGDDGNTRYAGHSMVINPNGEIIGELDDQSGVLTVDIDVEEVTKQRQSIPVFDNLKLDLYK
ncbi:carbon-nitrogen family hydrolase [Staphylococcus auricularis]|uniref:carbon-nitrogen family hydrolase n=1 Tax=Staphylococcus auricularis TaxID=29379 RepID=UPI003EC07DE1